ncbi:MAG: c-type cytochrome [Yoonia sp.]|uniref:c-type cytochrome n=1 Tax=Yoonia sp. TaxID=2212373 RepID=UPI003EF9D79F
MIRPATFGLALLTATAAQAHSGVDNPVVQARMTNMMDTAKALKTIGLMARGETTFDAEVARTAAAAIAQQADQIATVFTAPESHPKSEAIPLIWDEFEAFAEMGRDSARTARALSTSIETPDDLRPALAALGKTCSACHERYRAEN